MSFFSLKTDLSSLAPEQNYAGKWRRQFCSSVLKTLTTFSTLWIDILWWWILSLVNKWEMMFFSQWYGRLGSRIRTYDLLVTSPDALPKSYRRLVKAKAIKLGPYDKRPAQYVGRLLVNWQCIGNILNFIQWKYRDQQLTMYPYGLVAQWIEHCTVAR